MDKVIATLRTQYSQIAKPSIRRGSLGGVYIVVFHMLMSVGAAWICGEQINSIPHSLLYVLTVLFIGTRMRALANIVHECVHSSFVSKRRDNVVFGTVLALLDLRSFNQYRKEHFAHHRFLGMRGKDPDFRGDGHLLQYLKTYCPTLFAREDSKFVNAVRTIYFCGMIWLTLNPSTSYWFVSFFLIPFLTSYPLLRYFSDIFDHGVTTKNQAEFFRSRNHIFRVKLFNALFLPRHDGYHLIHHLFPTMPTRYFPEAHEMLMSNESYRQRKHIIF